MTTSSETPTPQQEAVEKALRENELEATALFEQMYAAEELPGASALSENPIIQSLPSDIRQVINPNALGGDLVAPMIIDGHTDGGLQVGDRMLTGKKVVYRTNTGQPVEVLVYLLPGTMQKLRADGKKAFQFTDPGFRPPVGQFPCFLNDLAPESAAFMRMGLPSCTKSDCPSEYDRDQHMLHRHKDEWKQVQETRDRAEKKEDREQAALLSQALAVMLGDAAIAAGKTPPEMVEDEPDIPEGGAEKAAADIPYTESLEAMSKPSNTKPVFRATCEDCSKESIGVTQKQANGRLAKHAQSHITKEE